MNTWTKKDEADLNSLSKRKAEVLAERRMAIADALRDGYTPSLTLNQLVEFMMQNAPAIRATLAPLDNRDSVNT